MSYTDNCNTKFSTDSSDPTFTATILNLNGNEEITTVTRRKESSKLAKTWCQSMNTSKMCGMSGAV